MQAFGNLGAQLVQHFWQSASHDTVGAAGQAAELRRAAWPSVNYGFVRTTPHQRALLLLDPALQQRGLGFTLLGISRRTR